jgi:hypothetical protein
MNNVIPQGPTGPIGPRHTGAISGLTGPTGPNGPAVPHPSGMSGLAGPAGRRRPPIDWSAYVKPVVADIFGKSNLSQLLGKPCFDGITIDLETGDWFNDEDGGGLRELILDHVNVRDNDDAIIAYAEECRRNFENGGGAPARPEVAPAPLTLKAPAEATPQTIAAFFSRVVPWPENPKDGGASGYVNLHWTIPQAVGKPRMAGKPVRTVVEFLRLAQWILRQPEPGDVYFCLSLQRTCARNAKGGLKAVRSADNALAFKAVWVDLDVKEGGYATIEEAVAALQAFMDRYQLPVPGAAVISGSGLHVYWISKRALSVDEWRSYAEGLKAAVLEFGLHCDVACSVNAAQLLRVPGTLNFKTNPPKPVFLSPLWGDDLDFATDLKMLVGLVPPGSKDKKTKKSKPTEKADEFKHLDPGKGLGEGIYPPLPVDPLLRECGFVREAYETGGKNFDNHLWNLTNLIAVFLEGGEKLIHQFSKGHKDYTEEETSKEWERKNREHEEKGVGWPSCKAIAKSGCKSCEQCAHFEKGKSPLNLALPSTDPDSGVNIKDFYAYMPMHSYIFAPSRELWPATSVNARIPPVIVGVDSKGKPITIPASTWIDQNQPVEMMTWAPGMPTTIADRLIAEGGWIERKGVSCFNLYRPPTIELGNAGMAGPWIDLVHKVYPDDTDHIIKWFAWRVQHPQIKINHGLFMGGVPGIGKDTIIEGARRAVGAWNFKDIAPKNIVDDDFHPWKRAVILRVNEAKDMGEVTRFELHAAMLTLLAAPPPTLECNEKHIKQHYILNCVGVVITSNFLTNGIYLPADDRRHYVAWSECKPTDFESGYWIKMWGWYDGGGDRHVAAYLATLDISDFDPKATPPKTAAFWSIVNANRTAEEAELQDILDELGKPNVITIKQLVDEAPYEPSSYPNRTITLKDWLKDPKNRKAVSYRLEGCGYRAVNNPDAEDGLWRIERRRQVVYAKVTLTLREQLEAARTLQRQTVEKQRQAAEKTKRAAKKAKQGQADMEVDMKAQLRQGGEEP